MKIVKCKTEDYAGKLIVIGCYSDTQILGNDRTSYCPSDQKQLEMCQDDYPGTTQTVDNKL